MIHVGWWKNNTNMRYEYYRKKKVIAFIDFEIWQEHWNISGLGEPIVQGEIN